MPLLTYRLTWPQNLGFKFNLEKKSIQKNKFQMHTLDVHL